MIGSTVSHYRITALIGSGGMGEVYRAVDTTLDREVALKFLPEASTRDPEAKSRFMIEAKAASTLDHPNICTVHEIGETEDGRMFIAMSCYRGMTLKERLERGPMPAAEVLEVSFQIARGLAKAHSAGIIHRDIKPANVFLCDDGLVKIFDFGLAKLGGGSGMTRPGATLGTVSFLSPEQVRGEEADARSDVWSFGVTMYAMAAGMLPFTGENDQAVLLSILNRPHEPLRALNSGFPQRFVELVESCLTKDPRLRCRSASAALAELQALRPVPRSETSETDIMATVLMEPPAETPVRRRVARVLAPALAAALIAVLAASPGLLGRIGGRLGLWASGGQRGVTVLPITLYGGDRSDQAFCDGLSFVLSEKITRLERFDPRLWVAPAEMVFDREVATPADARVKLGADLAVTGSMHRYGEVISLELVGDDTEPDRLSDLFQRSRQVKFADPINNLYTWQDHVALGVADMLEIQVDDRMREALAAGGTTSPEAYVACMRGCGYLHPAAGEPAPDLAEKSFLAAIAADSSYAAAYAGLAECLAGRNGSSAGDGPRFIELASRAAELDGGLCAGPLLLGAHYQRRGDHSRAAESYRSALAIDPACERACDGLAAAYAAMGDVEKAEAVFADLLDLRPADPYCHSYFAAFLYRNSRYDEAAEQIAEVLRLAPDYHAAYVNLGAIYFYLGRREESEMMFRKALAIAPSYRAYLNLGTLCFYSQRYLDSAQMYEKAVEMNPEHYQSWGQAAESYHWSGDPEGKASGCYRRAVELAEADLEASPRDPALLSALAGYLMKLGERDRAECCLERYLELEEHPPQTMFAVADVYEQMGMRDRALAWIEAAFAAGFAAAEVVGYPGMRKLRADDRFRALMARYSPEH